MMVSERDGFKVELDKVTFEEILQTKKINEAYLYLSDNEGRFDVGSWCYKGRSKSKLGFNHLDGFIRLVNASDLQTSRIEFVRYFLLFMCHAQQIKQSSHYMRVHIYSMRQFINWCDDAGVMSLCSSSEQLNAYSQYSIHLASRVRREEIVAGTAAQRQASVRNFLLSFLSDEDITILRTIPKLPKRKNEGTPTVPPNSTEAAEALSLYFSVFETFTKFLTRFEKYPFVIELRSDTYSCFPYDFLSFGSMTKPWSSTHHILRDRCPIDFQKMIICDVEEIMRRKALIGKDYNRHNIKTSRKRILKTIQAQNEDEFSKTRLYLARIAVGVFVSYFIANTSINVTQAVQLQWNDKYMVRKTEQNFRALKWRAGGKDVEFVTGVRFIKKFRQYLQLREYLLRAMPGKKTSLLFFNVDRGRILKICPKYAHKFFKKLNTHFGVDYKVTPKQWRAYNSHISLQTKTVEQTAERLQNKPDTIIRHYTGQNQVEAIQEMSEFFCDYESKIASLSDNMTTIPVGQCSNYRNPIVDANGTIIEPDCKAVEGCFSCQHHFVHADKKDVRKLLSYKYVLLANKPISELHLKESEMVSEVVNRIELLLEAIVKSKMVTSDELRVVRSEVFEREILSQYWDEKMSVLADLDII